MADQDFAVVIGISRYPYLKDLHGAVQDAEEFYNWLVGSARVPMGQINKVLSPKPPDPGNRPVQDDIDAAFWDIFERVNQLRARRIEPRRLYVYFAGHGCAREARHVALLMANARIESLNCSMDMESYHNILINRAIFPEQVFFYDCCRNYDRRVVGRRCPWNDDEPKLGSAAVKQVVLYGAGFTEYANERALVISERRGLFTRALLEGLSGGAAECLQKKCVVTSRTLARYVRERLNEMTQEYHLKQHLGWNLAGSADDLELVEVDTPGLWDVTVTMSAMSGEVAAYNSKNVEVDRQPISSDKLHFHLARDFYRFKVIPNGPDKLCAIGPGEENALAL